MDNEQLRELRNLVLSYQDKYVYYFLALTVTAIGFALTQTQDMTQFNWIDIALGISMLAWGVSFIFGTFNRERNSRMINKQHSLIVVQSGQDEHIGDNPEGIKQTSRFIQSHIDNDNNKLGNSGFWQRNCFFIGIISFVVWRILEIAIS